MISFIRSQKEDGIHLKFCNNDVAFDSYHSFEKKNYQVIVNVG
jgi:hypothetical protein